MSFKRLRHLIQSDIDRYIDDSAFIDRETMSQKVRLSVMVRPEIICIALYRLSHMFYEHKRYWLAGLVSRLNFALHKANIHPASQIGSRLRLPHPAGVTFEGHAGDNLTVFSLALCLRDDRVDMSVSHSDEDLENPEKRDLHEHGGFPTLGHNVVLGGQSAVIGDVQLGDHVTVAYRGIVTESIQSESLVFSRDQKLIVQSLKGESIHQVDAGH